MTTAEAKVILTAQDRTAQAFRSVKQSMDGLTGAAQSVQRAMTTIGVGVSVGAIVTGLTRAAAAAIQFGDEVSKASMRTGLGASAFAELAEAARLSDVEMAALSKGLRGMQVAISEFASGGKTSAAVFRALGISVEQLVGLKADQQLALIAEQLVALKDDTDRTRAGVALFGRAWESLAPFLLQGAKGIEEAKRQVADLGGKLTDLQIQKLADADDAIKRLDASWKGFARTLVAEVAPALTAIFDSLAGNTAGQVEADLGIALARQKELQRKQAVYSRPGYDARVLADINADLDATNAKIAALRQALNSLAPSSGPRFRTKGPPKVEAPPGFGGEPPKSPKSSAGSQSLDMIDVGRLDKKRLFDMSEALADINDKAIQRSAEFAVEISNDYHEVTEATKRWGEEFKAQASEWSVFADEAARQIQSSFANFLFDPFKDGLDGMLSGFLDTIRRMVAEIAAQEILRSLFSWAGGAIGGSIGNFVSGLAAPGRASGGPVTAGQLYTVGETGKEWFVPSTNGRIIPNGAMGGVSLTYNIDARGADAERIMAVIPGMLEQTRRQTMADMIRLQRQGRFA